MESYNTTGGVDFPTDSQDFIHTGENGMFVRLLVVPRPVERWPAGEGTQAFEMDGNLVGDDRPKIPDTLLEELPADVLPHNAEGNFLAEMNKLADPRTFHFPWLALGHRDSRDYLAVITLGSTSWCGHADTYWNCTKQDLNNLGRLIYESMQAMYEDVGDLVLTTWINT